MSTTVSENEAPPTPPLPRFSERQLQLLRAMNYNFRTGRSDTYYFEGDSLPGGHKLSGNGDNVTRADTIFRRYHVIRSFYENGVERVDYPGRYYELYFEGQPTEKQGNKKIALRFEGFAYQENPKIAPPRNIRQKMREAGIPIQCPYTGQTNNLDDDHREGRPQGHGFSDQTNPHNYQPLHPIANALKREACQICQRTNKRFDARTIHYPVGFIEGNEDFEIDGPGCRGCFWYDIKGFREALSYDPSRGQ